MIACCNDGTRPVIFKIERIDYENVHSFRQGLNIFLLEHISYTVYYVAHGSRWQEPFFPLS